MGKSIYILLTLGIIVLTIVGITSYILTQKTSLQNHANYNVHNYFKQFDNHINRETLVIKSFLKLVAEKENIYTAFMDLNKEKLFNDTKAIYNNLNLNNNITHFYFIKTDGEVFLRVHDFKRDSDVIKRYTFLKAKETATVFSGVEFGIKKNYTLRVVYPWIVEGQLIGYIEIGKEIDKVMQTLSDQLGIEVAIAVEKAEYKETLKLVQKRLETFLQTKTQYIVYSTLPKNKKLIQLFEESKQDNWINLQDKNYISYMSALEDVSKQKLGETLFLVDITSEYKELESSFFFYVSIMLVGTFLMLLSVYFFIRKKQQELDAALFKIDATMREKSSLLLLFEHGDSVLFKWNNDANWSINYVSSNVANLLGYTKEEFLSSKVTYAECIHKDDIDKVISEVEEGSSSSECFFRHNPYRVVTKDKQIKWVLDYTVIIKDADANIIHYLGYILDITEQENILKNLEKFIDTQDNIVILSDGKTIDFANKKFFDFFGHENLTEFKKVSDCICEYFVENDRFFHLGKIREDQNWIEEMQKLPNDKRIVAFASQNLTGHAFSVHINKFEADLLIVSFTDISATMLNQIELETKTLHDTLTGAYNREYFVQNNKRLIREYTYGTSRLALALLDIDHFKLVNDEYGHDIGDMVLKEFVKKIQESSRESDVFIRWGGEEFILLLKIKHENDLEKILEKIRKLIEENSFEVIGQKTCSIGATLYRDNEDIELTIKRADDAVYEAKDNGRNRVVFKL